MAYDYTGLLPEYMYENESPKNKNEIEIRINRLINTSMLLLMNNLSTEEPSLYKHLKWEYAFHFFHLVRSCDRPSNFYHCNIPEQNKIVR